LSVFTTETDTTLSLCPAKTIRFEQARTTTDQWFWIEQETRWTRRRWQSTVTVLMTRHRSSIDDISIDTIVYPTSRKKIVPCSVVGIAIIIIIIIIIIIVVVVFILAATATVGATGHILNVLLVL
jgi:hypothetical protein